MRHVVLVLVLGLTTGCAGTGLRYADLEAVSTAGPARDVLELTGWHGACDEVLPPQVDETPTEVRLRVPLRVDGGSCADVALVLQVRVELRDPLGERVVVDVERERPLPVRPG